MTHSIEADLSGAGLAAGLLAAEHFLMFEHRDRYHPIVRYVLGTLALGVGHTAACALTGDARGALRFWTVAISGGAAVVALYAARGELPGQERIEREAREVIADVRNYLKR